MGRKVLESLPSLGQAAEMLGLPVVSASVLQDREKDPGYFGPHSVTWKIMREPGLLMGGARALLMQAAHQLIAEAPLQTGSIRKDSTDYDPLGRLIRTGEWVGTVTFGTKREADEACRGVNNAHRKFAVGEMSEEHATSEVPAGTHFSAQDPELARWVHATLVDSLLVTYEALVGHLTPADQDRFVREWNVIGAKMCVRKKDFFQSRQQLSAYIDEQIATGKVKVGPSSMIVADTIFNPKLPLFDEYPILLKAWPLLSMTSRGLLPPALREQYGLKWTAGDQTRLDALLQGERWARRVGKLALGIGPPRALTKHNKLDKINPRRLRYSGPWEQAMKRAKGELGGH